MKSLILIFISIFLLSFISASCPAIDVDNLESIDSLDLSECNYIIPEKVASLIGQGVIELSIESTSLFASLEGNKLTSISKESDQKAYYIISTDRESFEQLKSSDNLGNTAMSLYKEGKIQIKANTFFNKIKLFFVKLFI